MSSVPGRPSPPPPPPPPTRFEYLTAVVRLQERSFAVTRSDILAGLDKPSAALLGQLGFDGWEMVSAVPFSSGGASMSLTGSANKTDGIMLFFKRPLLS